MVRSAAYGISTKYWESTYVPFVVQSGWASLTDFLFDDLMTGGGYTGYICVITSARG